MKQEEFNETVLITDEPYPTLPQTLANQMTDKDLIRKTLFQKGYTKDQVDSIIDECIIVTKGAYDDGYDFPLSYFDIVRRQKKVNQSIDQSIGTSVQESQVKPSSFVQGFQVKPSSFVQESQVKPSSFVQEPLVEPSTLESTSDSEQNQVETEQNPNQKQTSVKQKTKVIRVVKRTINKFSKILATAALVTAITSPLGIIPTTHVEEHQKQVPIEQVVQEEHSSYEGYTIGDKISLTDQAYYETGTLQGRTDVVSSDNQFGITPGDYDITGVVVLDELGNRIGADDNLVDLDLDQYRGENIGQFISQVCTNHNLDMSQANVSLHFGNQIGWIDADDVLGPNDLNVTTKTVVTGYETITTQETVQDGSTLNYDVNNVTPLESAAVAGLAGAALASAAATKRKNEKNLDEPMYREFATDEEYEAWKENELKRSEEVYEQQSMFKKLEQKVVSEQTVIQELTKRQYRELKKTAKKLSDSKGDVSIDENGHFKVTPKEEELVTTIPKEEPIKVIPDEDVTDKMYDSGATVIGRDNPVVTEIPLTPEIEAAIDDLNKGRHR